MLHFSANCSSRAHFLGYSWLGPVLAAEFTTNWFHIFKSHFVKE